MLVHARNFFYGITLLGVLFSPVSLAEETRSSLLESDQRFATAFHRTTEKLHQKANETNSFKEGGMNASLSKTSLAAQALVLSQDYETAELFAKEAQYDYRDNHFALLIEALALDMRGNETALALFDSYLTQSEKHNRVESAFLNPINFHEMRRSILSYLKTKGITAQILKPNKPNRRNPLEMIFQAPLTKYFYVAAFLLFIASTWLFILGTIRKIWLRFKPLEKGFLRCSNCKIIVSSLMLECPNCQNKL